MRDNSKQTSVRPTLADIAALSGVSRTTASFVLNGRTDMRIAEVTADRVRAAAADLGYRPNAIALALRGNSTQTIAMISDSIATNEYGGQMVAGALEAAQSLDKLLVVAETNGNQAIETAIIQDLLDRRVDGFIYATEATRFAQIPELLLGHRTVLLNCLDKLERLPSVIPDEHAAGILAAKTLTSSAHKLTAMVGTGHKDSYSLQRRVAGIRKALPKSRAFVELDCDWWPESAFAVVDEFLGTTAERRHLRPDSLICLNDRIAMGAYQALHEHGLVPGKDLSVVSFDDSLLAAWLRPGLTSVSMPHRKLGGIAVRQLVNWVGATASRVEQQEIAPTLTLRKSVRTELLPEVGHLGFAAPLGES